MLLCTARCGEASCPGVNNPRPRCFTKKCPPTVVVVSKNAHPGPIVSGRSCGAKPRVVNAQVIPLVLGDTSLEHECESACASADCRLPRCGYAIPPPVRQPRNPKKLLVRRSPGFMGRRRADPLRNPACLSDWYLELSNRPAWRPVRASLVVGANPSLKLLTPAVPLGRGLRPRTESLADGGSHLQ